MKALEEKEKIENEASCDPGMLVCQARLGVR